MGVGAMLTAQASDTTQEMICAKCPLSHASRKWLAMSSRRGANLVTEQPLAVIKSDCPAALLYHSLGIAFFLHTRDDPSNAFFP